MVFKYLFHFWRKSYNFDTFITEFFINDLEQYVEDTVWKFTGLMKVMYLLKLAISTKHLFFILHYTLLILDFEKLIKLYRVPNTITLTIKEKNNVLVISDSGKYFMFENYNKKFFSDIAPRLSRFYPTAFFLKLGVLKWEDVDHTFFEDIKGKIKDSFLFLFKKTSGDSEYTIETYSSIDTILRALHFLGASYYGKDFSYKLACYE